MKTFKATITGVTPLMMHSERLADPTNPITKALKKLTAKRQKTEEDHLAVKRFEWEGGLYTDETGVPAVPVDWILAVLLAGAKKSKQGPLAKAGIFSGATAFFPLDYPGPKTIEEMWADGRFCDYRGVTVGQAKVMRARPVFPGWTLTFSVDYDPDTIDGDVIENALNKAGTLLGMGDYRPRFGRFVVSEVSRG
jgi:hypothetical protein